MPRGVTEVFGADGLKRCTRCGVRKGPEGFYKTKAMCRDCRAETIKEWWKRNPGYKAAWRKANPAGDKAYMRRKQLREKYDLSPEDYTAMFESQEGRCALCRNEQSAKRALAVDHCHATGKIRTLLCDRCNIGIGMFKEDVTLLRAAIEYLEMWK